MGGESEQGQPHLSWKKHEENKVKKPCATQQTFICAGSCPSNNVCVCACCLHLCVCMCVGVRACLCVHTTGAPAGFVIISSSKTRTPTHPSNTQTYTHKHKLVYIITHMHTHAHTHHRALVTAVSDVSLHPSVELGRIHHGRSWQEDQVNALLLERPVRVRVDNDVLPHEDKAAVRRGALTPHADQVRRV